MEHSIAFGKRCSALVVMLDLRDLLACLRASEVAVHLCSLRYLPPRLSTRGHTGAHVHTETAVPRFHAVVFPAVHKLLLSCL